MSDAKDMALLCGPLFGEIRGYIDAQGSDALAMLLSTVNGTAVTSEDMPNVLGLADVFLSEREQGLTPVMQVLTSEQMDSRMMAGECAAIGYNLLIGLSAQDEAEIIFMDEDNPSISLWIYHSDEGSIVLLATFAQLRELVELVVLAEVQGSGAGTIH